MNPGDRVEVVADTIGTGGTFVGEAGKVIQVLPNSQAGLDIEVHLDGGNLVLFRSDELAQQAK